MSTGGATAGAAAAAAAQQQQQQEEEEEMAGYTQRDLAEEWEFKFLRANTAVFRDPEKLRQILAEEERAGWQLVEKFDDHRIRLKRPITARDSDEALEFDPYRTYAGMTDTRFAVIILVSVFGGIALIGLVIGLTALLLEGL